MKTNSQGKKEFLCHWLGFKRTWDEWIECDFIERFFPIGDPKYGLVELKWYTDAFQIIALPDLASEVAQVIVFFFVNFIPNKERDREFGSCFKFY